MSKAILLSGGMDSISLAFMERPSYAITIDYGQLPAATEIRSSSTVAELLGIEHYVISVDCSSLGVGDLINKEVLSLSPSPEWWPYRNQLLITLACMKGIKLGINELMLATVKSDEFHKDGTSPFFSIVNDLVEYQEGNIRISAPCINLTTTELVIKSKVPKDLLMWAHSCHKSNIACGNCRGCNKYAEVMNRLNYNEQIYE